MSRSIKIILILSVLLLSPCAMAFGPFNHLEVAEESFEAVSKMIKRKFPNLTEDKIQNLRSYYLGGALGPDLGYFPHGDLQMSILAHYLRSGDLGTTLIELSKTPEEYSFALGWRTHLDSDEYAHRFSVNKTVAESLGVEQEFPHGVSYGYDALAHNKVEAGGDLRLLKNSLYAKRGSTSVSIPLESNFSNGRNLIEEAYLRVYAYRVNHKDLIDVSKKMNEYLRFIPETFASFGYLPKKDQDGLGRTIAGLNRLTLKPLFLTLMKSNPDSFGSQAVLSPYAFNEEQWERHSNARKLAVKFVSQNIKGDLRIPNRNLDTGQPIFVDPFDPSADLLINIEKEHPDKTWEAEYAPEIAHKLISDWNRVLRQFDRRS